MSWISYLIGRFSGGHQWPVLGGHRGLGAGQRTDGVVIFERPNFKQSSETLFLQVADSGAVDLPALAPIGFGISSFRGGSAYEAR